MAGERQRSESSRAVQAANDYLRMGPGRSLSALLHRYSESERSIAPTLSKGTLFKWASKYGWVARAALYDAALESAKNERATQIMQSGLALAHERVDKLQRLADFLEGQMYEQGTDGVYHNIWLPDVKQIGSGDDAERVDIERFNAAIIEQYRGALDDIAKETGGRKQKSEISGPSGGPIEAKIIDSLTPEERHARLLALLEIAEQRKHADDGN